MADDIHNVQQHWLPERYQHLVWTTFEDITLIEEGTVFFDPARYAHYAGVVDNVTEANGAKFALIRWFKGADNIINDCIPFSRFAQLYLWWADPCMQKE